MKVVRGVAAVATAMLAVTVTAACSSSGSSSGGLSVVASTDVWGDVTNQVVGSVRGVTISSIITNPDADPHSYESNPRNALAVKRAKLVIVNGGGYDDFMGRLRSSTGSSAAVLNAVTISGHTAPAGGELNEHVWYDFPTVAKVADRIAAELGRLDPAHKGQFTANAKAFDAKLVNLEAQEAALARSYRGKGVAITEPVPLYLLQACGLVNRTPAKFSEAIEEGTDVSVGVLRQTVQLITSKQVRLLAYNEQTTGAVTEKVLTAARSASVPVVPVTETLPAGKSYLTWMSANLAAVRSALQRG